MFKKRAPRPAHAAQNPRGTATAVQYKWRSNRFFNLSNSLNLQHGSLLISAVSRSNGNRQRGHARTFDVFFRFLNRRVIYEILQIGLYEGRS